MNGGGFSECVALGGDVLSALFLFSIVSNRNQTFVKENEAAAKSNKLTHPFVRFGGINSAGFKNRFKASPRRRDV